MPKNLLEIDSEIMHMPYITEQYVKSQKLL